MVWYKPWTWSSFDKFRDRCSDCGSYDVVTYGAVNPIGYCRECEEEVFVKNPALDESIEELEDGDESTDMEYIIVPPDEIEDYSIEVAE